jgi:hypothetical protein
MHRIGRLITIAVIFFGFIIQSKADSFFANIVGYQEVSSNDPISLNSGVVTSPGFTSQGIAIAGPGTLGGLSYADFSSNDPGFGGSSRFSQEDSQFTLTGIHITGPGGGPGDPITVFFNVNVEGSIEAAATAGWGSQASVDLTVGAGSFFGGYGGVDLGSLTVSSDGTATRTGIFNNFASDGSTDSASSSQPSITTFAGDTISFSLHLSTVALTFNGFQPPGGNALAFADFSHTAGFDPSQPVLILPNGYSAYSDDGSIVNNHFVAPNTSTIPEPSSLVLFGSGLIGAIGTLRRRFRR